MKRILKTFLLLLVFFLSAPLLFNNPVWGASLKFDKTTVSVASGATFQIAVTVDPGSDSLNAAEAYVTFDTSVLKATEVAAGSLFPTVSNDISVSGKVYIAGYVDDPASSISSGGTVGTITFQALKDGNANLSFDCNTSKIIKDDVNASNVISCSQNGTAVVTVGSGGTNPATSPNTNPPSQLPQSGVFENVVKFALPGMVLLILGGALKLIL